MSQSGRSGPGGTPPAPTPPRWRTRSVPRCATSAGAPVRVGARPLRRQRDQREHRGVPRGAGIDGALVGVPRSSRTRWPGWWAGRPSRPRPAASAPRPDLAPPPVVTPFEASRPPHPTLRSRIDADPRLIATARAPGTRRTGSPAGPTSTSRRPVSPKPTTAGGSCARKGSASTSPTPRCSSARFGPSGSRSTSSTRCGCREEHVASTSATTGRCRPQQGRDGAQFGDDQVKVWRGATTSAAGAHG